MWPQGLISNSGNYAGDVVEVARGIRFLRITAFVLAHLTALAVRRARGVSKRVAVTKADLKQDPHAVWNAFVTLIATSFEHELTPLQRSGQLVFRYESEVQNGGHLQFFVNSTGKYADETIAALDALGDPDQARVLERATAQWNSVPRPEFVSLSEYSAMESKHEFGAFDREFHSVMGILERHLKEHEAEYIVKK